MTSEFFGMTSLSNIFDLFLLLILVTGPSFMSISSLVLELQQFSFITDWPEIRKSEIPPSEFCPRSEDWGKLGIPNLARMSLLKLYWMLQNVGVTAFTVSELLKENKQGVPPPPHFPKIKVKTFSGCWEMEHFLSRKCLMKFQLKVNYVSNQRRKGKGN